MEIAQQYSHLNGAEYLLVHHKKRYDEIVSVIANIQAVQLRTKAREEKTMKGKMLYSPGALNNAFAEKFNALGGSASRYRYYVTTNPEYLRQMCNLPYEEQRSFLIDKGIAKPIKSYKQTDFVKENLAVEVQFGKYPFVAYDLFVKHLLFYSGGVIDLGIEILPTKAMQSEMSSGIAYYEGEVYNILRHGRNNPPVPLLILGIEP